MFSRCGECGATDPDLNTHKCFVAGRTESAIQEIKNNTRKLIEILEPVAPHRIAKSNHVHTDQTGRLVKEPKECWACLESARRILKEMDARIVECIQCDGRKTIVTDASADAPCPNCSGSGVTIQVGHG